MQMQATRTQKRAFMTPPVSGGIRMLFSDTFRGRGMKKRHQVMSEFARSRAWSEVQGTATPAGLQQNAFKRLPDIDDPRPPIIGWANGTVDPDGSLKYWPTMNLASQGRKVIQGLYKDFKEIYNQHKKFIPLYGGGPWDPEIHIPEDLWVHDTAAVSGDVKFSNYSYIGPRCILRGDLNDIRTGFMVVLMDGVVITTDGHPLNTNLPGRVSRINEGSSYIGHYSVVQSSAVIDSATLSGYNEVGENCKIGYNAIMEVGSSLEPGSVLLAHQRVPRFEIWGGNPARRVGYRTKQMVLWKSYIESIISYRVRGLMDEQLYFSKTYVSATRSSEKLQFHMDRIVEQNRGKLPEKVQEYIAGEERDIPLWEEYKNHSRINVRPGVRKSFEWTYEPNKARWHDKY